MNAWATRLKSRMKELKITQAILAEKMGVTRGAVTHYLSGRRVPPLSQFQKLAAILKIDPAWLQYGTGKTADNTQLQHQKIITKNELIEKPIPIISWEQAAEFTDITKIVEKENK